MPFKQPGENLKCPFFFFCKGPGIMIATVVHEHPWHDFALPKEIARGQKTRSGGPKSSLTKEWFVGSFST
jgi:hypothetical protein